MVRALMSTTFEGAAIVGDLDGGQFLALLGEHFDARVIALKVEAVVCRFLDVEVDGGGAGSLGVGGHLELFLSWFLKLGVKKSR
jgi:hypothetical protein